MSWLHKNPNISILIIIGLTLLTLACQSVEFTSFGVAESPATSDEWPHSTFVPLRKNVAVGVEEKLYLESHHISPDKLDRLEIFVNGEPVEVETTSQEGSIFAYKSGAVQILVDAPSDETNSVYPKLSTSAWTVSMIWLARLPGTYELSLRVTDKSPRQGDLITQPIEVKE